MDADPAPVRVWGISDFHFGPSQTRGHFSSEWRDHQPRIRKAWDDVVGADDIVVCPGDLSWNADGADLRYELAWLEDRPGTVVLSRGNHDRGVWDEPAMRDLVAEFPSLVLLLDESCRIERGPRSIIVVGTMGCLDSRDRHFGKGSGSSARWMASDEERFATAKETLARLLVEAHELRTESEPIVLLHHYPPFANGADGTTFTWLIEQEEIDLCVYGHLHRRSQWREAFQGERNDVPYRFVAADYLGFAPRHLATFDTVLEVLPHRVPEDPADELVIVTADGTEVDRHGRPRSDEFSRRRAARDRQAASVIDSVRPRRRDGERDEEAIRMILSLRRSLRQAHARNDLQSITHVRGATIPVTVWERLREPARDDVRRIFSRCGGWPTVARVGAEASVACAEILRLVDDREMTAHAMRALETAHERGHVPEGLLESFAETVG